jgi:hypothetical protein
LDIGKAPGRGIRIFKEGNVCGSVLIMGAAAVVVLTGLEGLEPASSHVDEGSAGTEGCEGVLSISDVADACLARVTAAARVLRAGFIGDRVCAVLRDLLAGAEIDSDGSEEETGVVVSRADLRGRRG